jgi:trimethylamine:corrinoid methyltransferase-like protein
MRELLIDQPIFIGFKVDNQLREKLRTLDDAGRQYVSAEDSAFLRICMVGEDRYVGKLVDDRLTTDRVEDIHRNVLSIIRKLGHEVRMPKDLQILGCSSGNGDRLPAGGSHVE